MYHYAHASRVGVTLKDEAGVRFIPFQPKRRSGNTQPMTREISPAQRTGVPTAVEVETYTSAGANADRPFYLAVIC